MAHIELENVKLACAELMKLGYNSAQISQMFRVHEVHKRFDYISPLKLQYIVAHNMVKNLDQIAGKINEKMVIAYAKDLHAIVCNGCTGKVIAERAVSLDPIFAVQIPCKAHGDFFYITASRLGLPNIKDNFLLFIDEKSKVFLVFPILNDKEEEVRKVIELLIHVYKKYGHELKVIRFDNA